MNSLNLSDILFSIIKQEASQSQQLKHRVALHRSRNAFFLRKQTTVRTSVITILTVGARGICSGLDFCFLFYEINFIAFYHTDQCYRNSSKL